MATVYVSNTPINGFGVGSNSYTYNQSQSIATPKLTITGALAVALTGDTIVVNDGFYDEVSQINVTVSNITINGYSNYGATVYTSTGTTGGVFFVNATGTGVTFGKLILDATNTRNSCIQGDFTTNLTNLNINGTKMINWLVNGVDCRKTLNLSMDGGWTIIQTNSGGSRAITSTPATASTYTIQNGTITMNCGAATSFIGINMQPTVSGCSLTVINTTITIDCRTGTQPTVLQGISSAGCDTYLEHNNRITLLGTPSSSQDPIIHGLSATLSPTSIKVYNNTISMSSQIGIGVLIGADADPTPSGANSQSGVQVYNNKITGSNHGILLGWVTSGRTWGNTIDNCILGIVDKYSTNCIHSGNIATRIDPGSGSKAWYAKGSTNALFTNNTHLITLGYEGISMEVSNAGSAVFQNNIVYANTPITQQMVYIINDSSTATFSKNDYYSTSAFPAITIFQYQSTTYSTFSAWQSAKETTALNVDPTFVSLSSGNYRVPPSNSSLYHSGTVIPLGGYDFRGQLFYSPPTIGAYEVLSRDRLATTRNALGS